MKDEMDRVICRKPIRKKLLGAGSAQHLNLNASSPEITASGANTESAGDDTTLAKHRGEH
jgi:hypothetical protein